MSYTTSDFHTGLAYRLGETSVPNDSTTKAVRLAWANDGYLTIARRRYWWWQEASHSSNTNTGSTIGYTEPTDLKEFIEFKIGNIYYDQIPYKATRNLQNNISAVVTLPSLRSSYKFYRFASKYYLLPIDNADATAHSIKYWKRVSKVADGGTFLIPDDFAQALEAYAEARYWLSITQQAKAAVPFQEFEEVVSEMAKEQGRRGKSWAGFGIREPEEVYG